MGGVHGECWLVPATLTTQPAPQGHPAPNIQRPSASSLRLAVARGSEVSGWDYINGSLNDMAKASIEARVRSPQRTHVKD